MTRGRAKRRRVRWTVAAGLLAAIAVWVSPAMAGATAIVGALAWGVVRWPALEDQLLSPSPGRTPARPQVGSEGPASTARAAHPHRLGPGEELLILEAAGDGAPGDGHAGWVAMYVAHRFVEGEWS